MKLKFINPDSGMSRAELAAREALLSRAAGPDTAISMDCPQRTQVCIDSDLDVAVAAPEIVQMALQAQADGFDAVCLYCFSDPGLSACRELLQIPVVGGAQASLALAAQLGHRFSVLTTAAGRIPQKAAPWALGMRWPRCAAPSTAPARGAARLPTAPWSRSWPRPAEDAPRRTGPTR